MRVLPIVLMLVALPAEASDFGPGFLVVLVGGLLVLSWPLLIPLFYLRGAKNKITLYFALALTAFGLVSLLAVSFQILSLIKPQALLGSPAGVDSTLMRMAGLLYLAHLLAFLASFWVLPKVKRLLAPHPVAT